MCIRDSYRVMLVGRAWDALGVNGKTWIHREPRDRTLGEMLRRLQTSLTPSPVDVETSSFPAVAPVPASGDAGDGACVRVTAVGPVFEASQSWLKRRAEGVRPRRLAGHETRETSHLSDGVERSGGSGSRADPLVIDGPENDEASFTLNPMLDAEDAWDGGGFPTACAFVHLSLIHI